MYLKKIILKSITKNIEHSYFENNFKNSHIYKFITILGTIFHTNSYKSISFSNNLNIKNKFLLIIFSIAFNFDLYLFEINLDNCLLIESDNHLEKLLNYNKDIDFNIIKKNITYNPRIFYKIKNEIKKITTDKITEFYNCFKIQFSKIISNKNKFKIKNFSKIYFIYFIPFIINFKLKYNDFQETLNISDEINSKYKFNLFIGNKFITQYSKNNIYSIFYSYTLGQFLMDDVKIDNNKIVGKLFDYHKVNIINNIKYIIYNKKLIKFPESYNLIGKNILTINKKTSKLFNYSNNQLKKKNININSLYRKYEFSKLVYCSTEIELNKSQCYKLYKSILETYPELILTNENYFFFNQNNIIKYTPFSMYFYNNNSGTIIIIQISKEYITLEKNILTSINNNIYALYKLENIYIKKIYSNIQTRKIHIFSEIKFLFVIVYNIIPCYFRYLLNIHSPNNILCSRNQYIYKFDQTELYLLKKQSLKLGLKFTTLFKCALIMSINNLYDNLLILFSNNKDSYIYPSDCKGNLKNISNKLKIYERAHIFQKFLKKTIFSYLNNLMYNSQNSDLVIFIDEIIMNDKLNFIKLEKSTSKFNMHSVPIQITYYIYKNSLNLTISSLKNYKNIKYIIPEILNILKSI